MKSTQEQIIEKWKADGLDITDTRKMHKMAESAIRTIIKSELNGKYNLRWAPVIIIAILSLLTSALITYVAIAGD